MDRKSLAFAIVIAIVVIAFYNPPEPAPPSDELENLVIDLTGVANGAIQDSLLSRSLLSDSDAIWYYSSIILKNSTYNIKISALTDKITDINCNLRINLYRYYSGIAYPGVKLLDNIDKQCLLRANRVLQKFIFLNNITLFVGDIIFILIAKIDNSSPTDYVYLVNFLELVMV